MRYKKAVNHRESSLRVVALSHDTATVSNGGFALSAQGRHRRSYRTVFVDEGSLSASRCRSPCCFGVHPCPWWPQIAATQAPSLCRRPFGAIVVLLLVKMLLKIFGGSCVHLQGDSEVNTVNFLQTGVATFVCLGNKPFILACAGRLAWAFVRPPLDRLPWTHTRFLTLSRLASHLYSDTPDAFCPHCIVDRIKIKHYINLVLHLFKPDVNEKPCCHLPSRHSQGLNAAFVLVIGR